MPVPNLPHRQDDGSPAPSAPEAIARRRATRRFDPDRPLPDALLKHILHLATRAPSGFNLQPWRFIVVRSGRNRRKLRGCANGQPQVSEAPVVLIVLGYHHPHRSDLDAVVATQVALGAITPEGAAELRARASRTMERVADRAVWATRSTMLAAATLLIAAESLGVASAPLEGFDPARVKEAFGVPDDHTVCCLIALGFAAEAPPFPGRFGLEHVCYQEHFGQPWTLGEP
jgi:nitroreductase